jgi:hypothetical protein
MALHPFVGPWPFFSFVFLYTVCRTPWTGDQPVSRPLPTRRTTQTQNKRTHIHQCLEWDLNPRSQRSSRRRPRDYRDQPAVPPFSHKSSWRGA